jgi:hypothetical protein
MKNKLLFVGLVSVFVLLSGCLSGWGPRRYLAPPPPGGHYGKESGRVFPVLIYQDSPGSGHCLVDINVATLWAMPTPGQPGQSVLWISDDGGDYFVDFCVPTSPSTPCTPSTPFASPGFWVPSNGSVPSGGIQGSPAYYPYQIHLGKTKDSPLCKTADDPGFYVK